jgi:8-oxo-dGTP pyrophosphatase MutT (NUDIX family)
LSFDPARYLRFIAEGQQIGWLRPALAARLAAWPGVFDVQTGQVGLLQVDQLAAVVEQLAREGFVPGWRNERYRIADLFEIERAAARPFGLTTHAVHVNGIVAGKAMWIARRSPAKPIDPGLLDNLVGGGMTAGLTREEVLQKEAWEEAGIAAPLARAATPGGTVRILREVPEGVQSEVIYVYDLALPEDFEPKNQDGEVSHFMLLPFAEITKSKLTFEAALVAADYFKRSGA